MIDSLSSDKKLYGFDLFDTLVSRPLKRPVYLFDLVELTGHVSYRLPLLGKMGFRFWRVQAERLARLFSRREDIQLKDIYRFLGCVISHPSRTARQELRIELNLIRPIPAHVEILHKLVSEGKRCCIITDVYLPVWFIRAIIHRHIGIEIDFFSSSHHGVTKATGNLFRLVADHYRIDYGDALHIGDNPHSDVRMPGQLGMEAHKVPERSVHDSSNALFEYFSPRELSRSLFSRLGYHLVGPMCISFALFIKKDIERRGIDKVFFGARDGYLVKEAFDLISPGTRSRYIRLSRRALYVPAFAFHDGHEKFFEGRVSGSEFFERIGLAVPGHLRNLDPIKHRDLFEHELVSMNFRQHALAEAEVLTDYLRSNDFTGRVAFVDLGWRGSLQESLQAILGDSCEIQGYYFGTIVDGKDKHAYFFRNCLPARRFSLVFQAIPVFEFLFTEPVTSLRHISRADEGFSFEHLNDESESQLSVREEIAEGCRNFFSDFAFIANQLHVDDTWTRDQVEMLVKKFLYKPNAELTKAFEGITHSEGFGGSKNNSIISRSKFTLSGYRNSYWRAAYVSTQEGTQGWAARLVHGVAHSSLCLFLIHKSHRIRRLIDRLTA